jgi:hypothetical protein
VPPLRPRRGPPLPQQAPAVRRLTGSLMVPGQLVTPDGERKRGTVLSPSTPSVGAGPGGATTTTMTPAPGTLSHPLLRTATIHQKRQWTPSWRRATGAGCVGGGSALGRSTKGRLKTANGLRTSCNGIKIILGHRPLLQMETYCKCLQRHVDDMQHLCGVVLYRLTHSAFKNIACSDSNAMVVSRRLGPEVGP